MSMMDESLLPPADGFLNFSRLQLAPRSVRANGANQAGLSAAEAALFARDGQTFTVVDLGDMAKALLSSGVRAAAQTLADGLPRKRIFQKAPSPEAGDDLPPDVGDGKRWQVEFEKIPARARTEILQAYT